MPQEKSNKRQPKKRTTRKQVKKSKKADYVDYSIGRNAVPCYFRIEVSTSTSSPTFSSKHKWFYESGEGLQVKGSTMTHEISYEVLIDFIQQYLLDKSVDQAGKVLTTFDTCNTGAVLYSRDKRPADLGWPTQTPVFSRQKRKIKIHFEMRSAYGNS